MSIIEPPVDSGRRFSTDSALSYNGSDDLNKLHDFDSPHAFNDALNRITSCVDQSPLPGTRKAVASNGFSMGDSDGGDLTELLYQSGDHDNFHEPSSMRSDSLSQANSGHSIFNGEEKSGEVIDLENKLRQAAEVGNMLVEREEEFERRIEKLSAEKERLESDLEDLRIDHTDAVTRSDQMKEQLDDSHDRISRLESKLRESEEATKHYKGQHDELQRQHSDLTQIHRQLQSDFRAEREMMLSQISGDNSSVPKSSSTSSGSSEPNKHSKPDITVLTSLSKDLGLLDTSALIAQIKDVRERNSTMQAKLAKKTDELQETQRQLEATERRSQRLTRELKEERKANEERQRSHEYMQDLKVKLEKEQVAQREVMENMEREKNAIAGKMESMEFSALHYQKKWDEEKRLRAATVCSGAMRISLRLRNEQLEQSRSHGESVADDDAPAASSAPQAASKSLFDELQRMEADNNASPLPDDVDSSSSEEPSAARDCNQEFFYLTCLSVKVGLATRYKTDLSSLRSAELFELSRKKRVPFHQYHHFVEQQVIADYRKKAIRQKEAQEKRRAVLAQQQAERSKQLEQMSRQKRTQGASPGRPPRSPNSMSRSGDREEKRGARGMWNQFKETLYSINMPSVSTNGSSSPRNQSRQNRASVSSEAAAASR